MKTLTLTRGIVGVHGQQGAGYAMERHVEFHLEAVGRLGHDVDEIQEGCGEVVGVFGADEEEGQ